MQVRDDLSELAAFAETLADAAAGETLAHFRAPLQVESKEGREFDPVTVADRGAEAVMRELIAVHYPGHGIIGEEHGREGDDRALQWILDPIDGTRAYVVGMPTWGTLIGLYRDGRPLLGVMDQPYVGERFIGISEAGGGLAAMHKRNGESRRLKTRPCESLTSALAGATDPYLFAQTGDDGRFERLRQSVRLMRFGFDWYAFALLASGQLDIVIEPGLLQIYDVAAAIPLVEAAGGVITSLDGSPVHQGGSVLAAGDPRLHAKALDLLNR